MSGERGRLIGALGHGSAIAMGLSATFLLLVVVASPLVATVLALPASMGVGLARARLLPLATPHCLTAPTFTAAAVTSAPRATTLVSGGGVTSAA